MRYKKFKNAEIEVSQLAVGTWAIGGQNYGKVDKNEAICAIRRMIENGVNLIDTAPCYGNGTSEKIVGEVLKEIPREQVLISTKFGLIPDIYTHGYKKDTSYKNAMREIQSSLMNLETDYIDFYFVHWPDVNTPIDETMAALEEMKRKGYIRYVGVSNFTAEQIKEAEQYIQIDVQQPLYSMVDRGFEDLMSWGYDRGIDSMPKAKVKDILTYATENKFGVAAINTLNIETVKYVIEAAERERVPIIVQFYPGFSDYTDLKHLAFAACDMAEKASIPVGVHLDHSVTYEIAVGGIRDGFPSVMIDGSTKSFQENVELTKNVVRVAKVFGVDVEAELGHVGNGDSIDAIDNTNYYTKVEDAVRFVEQTGCDSLAIAVGNAHGPYVKTPNLDLERIYAIRKKVNIPLVLHGCSDIPEEQMKEAVNLGMSKFNIATEYFRTMYQSIEKRINNQEFEGNGVKLMYDIKEEMIDFVIQKIRLLNPNKYSM